jgi:hypothetical protein
VNDEKWQLLKGMLPSPLQVNLNKFTRSLESGYEAVHKALLGLHIITTPFGAADAANTVVHLFPILGNSNLPFGRFFPGEGEVNGTSVFGGKNELAIGHFDKQFHDKKVLKMMKRNAV